MSQRFNDSVRTIRERFKEPVTRWLHRRYAAHVLSAAAACIWAVASPARFSSATLGGFGFTYTYTQIADTSMATGRYASTLSGETNHNYESARVVDEVQREPLYPAALMAVARAGHPYTALLRFQRLAVALALYVWGVFAARKFGLSVFGGMFFLVLYAPTPAFYVSVLYPYAFQFLMITCAMVAAIHGLHTRRPWYFLLSGAAQGAACYERGAYLFLPLALTAAVFVLRPGGQRHGRHLALMLASTLAVTAPWLIRSARLGQTGMNGMTGYALGFSYGTLSGGDGSAFAQSYDEAVREKGPDAGTSAFLARVADRENIAPQEVDHRLVRLLLRKILSHPLSVAKIMAVNYATLPVRLTGVDNSRFLPSQYDRDPGVFFKLFLERRIPTVPDLLVFALALWSLVEGVRQRDTTAIVVAACLAYTAFFVCSLVFVDPRYRGAVDIALYIMACAKLRDLIQRASPASASPAAEVTGSAHTASGAAPV